MTLKHNLAAIAILAIFATAIPSIASVSDINTAKAEKTKEKAPTVQELITKTVQTHRDALRTGDYNKLGQAWHESAKIQMVSNNGEDLVTLERDKTLKAWAKAPDKNAETKIHQINLIGKDMAVAHVEVTYMKETYVDILVFMKDLDDWRIISKTFTPKNPKSKGGYGS